MKQTLVKATVKDIEAMGPVTLTEVTESTSGDFKGLRFTGKKGDVVIQMSGYGSDFSAYVTKKPQMKTVYGVKSGDIKAAFATVEEVTAFCAANNIEDYNILEIEVEASGDLKPDIDDLPF